jgi:predicted helicase
MSGLSPVLNLNPSSAPVRAYYTELDNISRGHFDNEGNIRGTFESLLKKCAVQFDWTLVPEYPIARKGLNPIRIDAALLDSFNLPRGYWEAKDEKDTLIEEMEKKFRAGYPRSNILFQRPTRALLFQDGRIAFNDSIENPHRLVDLLHRFYEWRQPDHDTWDHAVREFSQQIPNIARGALKLIEDERRTNKVFVERFAAFAQLCRESINPDLRDQAVEEMLVQHLLTERIFRRIFDNPEFTRRNVIAAEIERVIDSLTKRHFSRDAFLRDLDPFYKAIEEAAASTESYAQKQAFLNRVYERFFQGFNRKQADTHGIVYTPQPIVDFMVRSAEEVLKTEFGRSLSDKDVHILDPFVGTGNFITRVMQEIRTSRLPHKYKQELHCNEIMLLPYYIASMNIEHAYLDRTGEYEPFEGICLADTFDMRSQVTMFAETNTLRIRRQRLQPIFVVIGNPPYNVGQDDENDNNRNRRYIQDGGVDLRVAETYGKSSSAVNTRALGDPYIKALRWASDRISKCGIVVFVSNNGFLDALATDGVRMHLQRDFDEIFILDLGGNVRRNPKLSGTRHNVFGIQVGVSINIFIRREMPAERRQPKIFYARTEEFWTRGQKESFLEESQSISRISWSRLEPDARTNWLRADDGSDFSSLTQIADAKVKSGATQDRAIFQDYSRGAETTRDAWSYSFSRTTLEKNVQRLLSFYNSELRRWHQNRTPLDRIDSFLSSDPTKIKWCSKLKQLLDAGVELAYGPKEIRRAIYRPFTSMSLYFEDGATHRRGRLPYFLPTEKSEGENYLIWVKVGSDWPMFALGVNQIPDLLPQGGSQCFPFYAYDEAGTNRRENITDWALAKFRHHYADSSISKWNIFHYTYALLHHPEYRTRYAANLKRELPRIPMAPEFHRYADIGAKLMDIHTHYEKQPEYPLERTEAGKLDWHVEKMTLSKDKTQVRYNGFLTLSGIPPEVYEYRLGNRCALEWVVDQYQVSKDKRSGIVNDPNRPDDPEYIVRLIGQIVTVSLKTVKLSRELSRLIIDSAA